jgi:uncharacterized membrane protein YedE/YeeE
MPDLIHIAPYLIIGALAGATLNYFQFGFSSSFQHLVISKDTRGTRAIIWMLVVAIALFAPMLAVESWQGRSFQGYIRPLSLAIPIGALIFGIGMQVGCGCASGTLARVGQLQSLSLITLSFMIIGGTLAAATYSEWQTLPAVEPFAFQRSLNWLPGLATQFLLLFAIYRYLLYYEHKHTGEINALLVNKHPFLLAGIALAILNASLLFFTGYPWSISSTFPFWGTQIITLLELPFDWEFWEYTLQNETRMNLSLFEHPVSLTSIGVILGALGISIIQPNNRKQPSVSNTWISMIAGILMGFGGVMASGCNIGAFFSGIASGSLHGWVWLVFALIGNIVVLKITSKKWTPIQRVDIN